MTLAESPPPTRPVRNVPTTAPPLGPFPFFLGSQCILYYFVQDQRDVFLLQRRKHHRPPLSARLCSGKVESNYSYCLCSTRSWSRRLAGGRKGGGGVCWVICVSIIIHGRLHLTWTVGALACVCDLFCTRRTSCKVPRNTRCALGVRGIHARTDRQVIRF